MRRGPLPEFAVRRPQEEGEERGPVPSQRELRALDAAEADELTLVVADVDADKMQQRGVAFEREIGVVGGDGFARDFGDGFGIDGGFIFIRGRGFVGAGAGFVRGIGDGFIRGFGDGVIRGFGIDGGFVRAFIFGRGRGFIGPGAGFAAGFFAGFGALSRADAGFGAFFNRGAARPGRRFALGAFNPRAAVQWRKCRVPVNTIAISCALAAAMTSSSRLEPPG